MSHACSERLKIKADKEIEALQKYADERGLSIFEASKMWIKSSSSEKTKTNNKG